MATCRIYFYTYKRNHLLPRAIQSLVDQTFRDWVCEVHNDCPGDKFPAAYIHSLNDPRFVIKNHEINLGGTASFNLAFSGCEEDYVSILEDDNWWEPDFLWEMIQILESKPHINIAWSNMRIWKENAFNQWENTNETVWLTGASDTLFNWPNNKQAMGALHSNGAMLYRGKFAKNYRIPDNTEFGIIEGTRERSFEFPIYFTGQILANFSQTQHTNRSADALVWTNSQIMLLGSFIEGSNEPEKAFKEALVFYRQKRPSPVTNFFLVVIFILKRPSLMKYFNLTDWAIFSRWLLKNGFKLAAVKARLKSQQDVYDYLLKHTIERNRYISIKDNAIGD